MWPRRSRAVVHVLMNGWPSPAPTIDRSDARGGQIAKSKLYEPAKRMALRSERGLSGGSQAGEVRRDKLVAGKVRPARKARR